MTGEIRTASRASLSAVDIVDANNRAAILKEPAREAKSDKACRAGD